MQKDGINIEQVIGWLLGDISLGEIKGSLSANGYAADGAIIPHRSLKLSVMDKGDRLTVIDSVKLGELGAQDIPSPALGNEVPFHFLANFSQQDVLVQFRPEEPLRQMAWQTLLLGGKEPIDVPVELIDARNEIVRQFPMTVSEITTLQFAFVNITDFPRFSAVRFRFPPGLVVGPLSEVPPPN